MTTREFLDNKERKANGLIHEKSPYLLQHAYNPVDWYPWGEEAFSKAQERANQFFCRSAIPSLRANMMN